MNKIVEISIKIIKSVWLFIFLMWNFMIFSVAGVGLYTISNQPNLPHFTEKVIYYIANLMPIYALMLLTAVLYYTIKIWGIDKIVLNKWRTATNGRN